MAGTAFRVFGSSDHVFRAAGVRRVRCLPTVHRLRERESIYEDLPFLERDWEGYRGAEACRFAQMQAWYHSRISRVKGPVCELACGYGRLLVELARVGIEVHGTDVAPARLQAARQHFDKEGLGNAHFHLCPMPNVPQGVKFAAIILAANAVGYLTDGQRKRELFANIAGALADDGLLLMDHGRGSAVLRLLRFWPGLRGRLGKGDRRVRSSLQWSRSHNVILETFFVREAGAPPRIYQDTFRFDHASTTLLRLKEAGFKIVETCGSFEGSQLRPWSRILAVTAQVEKTPRVVVA